MADNYIVLQASTCILNFAISPLDWLAIAKITSEAQPYTSNLPLVNGLWGSMTLTLLIAWRPPLRTSESPSLYEGDSDNCDYLRAAQYLLARTYAEPTQCSQLHLGARQ